MYSIDTATCVHICVYIYIAKHCRLLGAPCFSLEKALLDLLDMYFLKLCAVSEHLCQMMAELTHYEGSGKVILLALGHSGQGIE